MGVDVPDPQWALEQSFGVRRQSCAIRTTLGWILLGSVDQGAEAEVGSLIKQFDLLCNNEVEDIDCLRANWLWKRQRKP